MLSSASPPDHPHKPVTAWILAAGQGRRMGGCAKPALQIGGVSILESLVRALREGGCDQVNVLAGLHAEAIRPLALRSGARLFKVRKPTGTLADTQRDAVELHALHHADTDMMVTVADLPLLRAPHVQALLSAWAARPHQAAMAPIVDGQRGHPVLLAAAVVQDVAGDAAGGGIRDWLQARPERLTLWPSTEGAHVADLDTPEDLARLQRGP